MTQDEAKFILSAYRPSGRDATDPGLREAVARSELDPALAAWFSRSRALDAAVAGKLAALVPPPGLRGAILAGARASAAERRSRRTWVLLAAGLAASIALLLTAALWRPGRTAAGPMAFAQFALNDMVHGRHGGEGEAMGALQRELSVSGAALPGANAIDFDRLRATGCRTLSFAGHDVLEVCFARGKIPFHFYVLRKERPADEGASADRGKLAATPASSSPSFLTRAGGTAAVWSDRRFDYALVSAAGLDAVRKLL